jgi:hypothetical protein
MKHDTEFYVFNYRMKGSVSRPNQNLKAGWFVIATEGDMTIKRQGYINFWAGKTGIRRPLQIGF